MINQESLALGTKRNTIMELADYGRRCAAQKPWLTIFW